MYSRTIFRNYAASGVAGRYTGFDVDSGHNKAVGYDNLGRLNTVARGSDAFAYSFVANSNLVASIAKPGNLITAFAYEANRDLLTSVDNKYNATTVSNYGYVNDTLYRRGSMSRSGSAFAVADTIGYAYNDRSEVIGAASDNVPSYAYGYGFDNIGNRLTASLSGANWTYNANNLNQYTSVFDGADTQTPGYNPDGCMTSYGDWTYTWNAENRLVEAVSADTR